MFDFHNLNGAVMKKTLARMLAIIVIAFSFLNSKPALATPSAVARVTAETVVYQWRSPQFKLGSTTVASDGSVISYPTDEFCSAWMGCEKRYGDCDIAYEGSRDPKEYQNKAIDPALQGGLASGRAGEPYSAMKSACSQADDDAKMMPPVDSKVDGFRYVMVKVISNSSVPLAELVHACNNGEDDDGDGLTDGQDPGCKDGKDDSEFNRTELNMYQTGIRLARVFRDASDRKCPWEIKATYNENGNIVVETTKTDLNCTCDGEHSYAKEEGYEKDLEAEISHPPLRPDKDANLEAQRDWYDSVQSKFFDDIGVTTWNETMFQDYGYIKVIKDRNECIAIQQQQDEGERSAVEWARTNKYTGTDLVVLGSVYGGGVFAGNGTGIDSSVLGIGTFEFGFETGNPDVALLATIGAGWALDRACDAPSSLVLPQVRLGVVTGRAARAGLLLDARAAVASGLAPIPDDPSTKGVSEYGTAKVWAPAHLPVLFDIGARISLGKTPGVKDGAWLALSLTGGPIVNSRSGVGVIDGTIGGTGALGTTW